MSISYSGLTNFGKASLPSVEGWGTSINILKDPPRSIMTRRINKVGDTSMITETIDESTNRMAEAITVYSRGTNPSVSVMYSNNGTCGGENRAFRGSAPARTDSFLPYRIMNGGAFRPPILTQEQLLPLSRQRRTNTAAFTRKGFADFSKKLRTCGTAQNTAGVKNSIVTLNTDPASRKIKNKLAYVEPPADLKHKVRCHAMMEGQSGSTNKCHKRVYPAGRNKVNTDPYTVECVTVRDVGFTKVDKTIFKQAVNNTLSTRQRNVPLSTWSSNTFSARDTTPRNVSFALPSTLPVGGFLPKSSIPAIAERMMASVKCNPPNVKQSLQQLPLVDNLTLASLGACGTSRLTIT